MKKFIDVLYNKIIGNFVKVLGTVMVLSILVQIFMRYVPTNPFMWTEEMARLTFVWFCFMSATIGLIKGMHLSIDYFYNKASARLKSVFNFFSWLLIMVFSVIITYNGIFLVKMTYMQKSPIMSLPLSYFYAAIPVAGGLFLIYGVTIFIDKAAPYLRKRRG